MAEKKNDQRQGSGDVGGFLILLVLAAALGGLILWIWGMISKSV